MTELKKLLCTISYHPLFVLALVILAAVPFANTACD
jgi:hypothetical protein